MSIFGWQHAKVWSQIVVLFGQFFRYTVLFLVFTVFTSIMNFFLQFPFKPPSKIRPEGPEALKPPALRAGFLRGIINRLLLSYNNAFEMFTGVSNFLLRKIMGSSQNETLNHSQ